MFSCSDESPSVTVAFGLYDEYDEWEVDGEHYYRSAELYPGRPPITNVDFVPPEHTILIQWKAPAYSGLGNPPILNYKIEVDSSSAAPCDLPLSPPCPPMQFVPLKAAWFPVVRPVDKRVIMPVSKLHVSSKVKWTREPGPFALANYSFNSASGEYAVNISISGVARGVPLFVYVHAETEVGIGLPGLWKPHECEGRDELVGWANHSYLMEYNDKCKATPVIVTGCPAKIVRFYNASVPYPNSVTLSWMRPSDTGDLTPRHRVHSYEVEFSQTLNFSVVDDRRMITASSETPFVVCRTRDATNATSTTSSSGRLASINSTNSTAGINGTTSTNSTARAKAICESQPLDMNAPVVEVLMRNLTKGRRYFIRVRALNFVCPGPWLLLGPTQPEVPFIGLDPWPLYVDPYNFSASVQSTLLIPYGFRGGPTATIATPFSDDQPEFLDEPLGSRRGSLIDSGTDFNIDVLARLFNWSSIEKDMYMAQLRLSRSLNDQFPDLIPHNPRAGPWQAGVDEPYYRGTLPTPFTILGLPGPPEIEPVQQCGAAEISLLSNELAANVTTKVSFWYAMAMWTIDLVLDSRCDQVPRLWGSYEHDHTANICESGSRAPRGLQCQRVYAAAVDEGRDLLARA
jgi:hypothetical protein